jgi:hypothetical protein
MIENCAIRAPFACIFEPMRLLTAALVLLLLPLARGEEVTFNGACDASAAVALDSKTFVVADDENNILRTYSLDRPGMPLAEFPMGRFLKTNVEKHPEADIEACTRVGNRIYWIASHGRSKKGKWRRSRYLFFATKIVKRDGAYRIVPEGRPVRNLLEGLLRIPGIGAELTKAVGVVGDDAPAALAPKASGMNIEGLTVSADGSVLYLGLRNPRPGGRAILVPLQNAAALVMEGAAAEFGKPLSLDLGGRGIRSIEYSPRHRCYFIAAGAHDNADTSAIYSWDGVAASAPVSVRRLGEMNPEAIAPVPGSDRLQIFSDDGNVRYRVGANESIEPLEHGQCACKHLKDPRKKAFRSVSIAVATPQKGG